MAEKKVKLSWDILDKKRQALLPKIAFLKDAGFYLAGGTALALQIRHRLSVDFDFYNQKKFDSAEIYHLFQAQKLKSLLLDAMSDNTLILEANGIASSFFYYGYPLLKPLVISKHIKLASLEDIAAMKLIAIIQRGVKRDFIDLYFLAEELGLENIMALTKRKYAGFNRYLACQALVYFNDADKRQDREAKMLKPLDWKRVKAYFETEISRLKRGWSQDEE